nr:uncharacterized protein LOC107003290 [Ipomoea trifida]
MPFSGVLLVSAATRSAEIWQYLACLPEHIASDQLLDLVLCFPAQQLGRMILRVWNFFCVPPTPYYIRRYSYNSSSSSSSDDDDDDNY